MENSRNTLVVVIAFLTMFVLSGCSSDDDDDTPTNLAPESVAGKAYRIDVSAGSGLFASDGNATIFINETEDTYELIGDVVNSGNSLGVYVYSPTGNSATFTVIDSGFGNGTFSLAFTAAGAGTYSATIVSDPDSSQSGVFTEVPALE